MERERIRFETNGGHDTGIGYDTSARYFDFVVELRGIEPTIWRRFLLRLDQTFEDLHLAIQAAAGWQNYQLYRFWNPANGKLVAHSYEELLNRCPEPPGGILPLTAHFSDDVHKYPGQSIVYEYELRTWFCDVKLVGMQKLPVPHKGTLLEGARAFPLEDCRGLSGYEECVAVARAAEESGDPNYEDADGLMSFMGEWRPDAFDLEKATLGLYFV